MTINRLTPSEPVEESFQPARWGPVRAWLAALPLLLGCVLTAKADDRDIVINEIMYHPPQDRDNLQFVELFNRGDREVSLAGWSFTKGIKFVFPPAAKLGPKSYFVICSDQAAFSAHYGPTAAVAGVFAGKLSHKGERLELSNAQKQVIESVEYADGGDWPRSPDGYSSSLERICPAEPADKPENWAPSALPQTKRAAGSPGRQNDSFAASLPPVIAKVEFTPRAPSPEQPVKVTAHVRDAGGVRSVALFYRVASAGRLSEEQKISMRRSSGSEQDGQYEADIPAQPNGQLVRFRINAAGAAGSERIQPSPHEALPTYSYFSFSTSQQAAIPVGHMINVGRPARGPGHYERVPNRPGGATPTRGNGAFLYVPPEGSPQTFDYVRIVSRHGGFKLHFQKEQPLKGMPDINLISEGPLRWILAEPLAYALYRMAEVPSPLTEHVRLSMDGRLLGVHLLVEQPNTAFLARNSRDTSGNLYKLLWYGDGVVGQHEKKTNPSTGHQDIVQLIQGLRRSSGAEQWAFIQEHFNVEEAASYYAVNMCIQNWDGFFNNYFAYHDTGGTGKWEIYPWDEDKTWGDYDGASPRYDWYEMPLTMGMAGDSSPRDFRSRFGGGGPFGGVSWWRPAGYFSGPLLANPEFRKRFLLRLEELCTTVFTEETFRPIIDTMERRLEPEITLRAQAQGADPRHALREFAGYMQSFRAQVQNRRKFILNELQKNRQ